MSSPLAIAAVTAVLKDLLNNAMIDHAASVTTGAAVNVTARPPDRIKVDDQETAQLNLFLYHVAPNPGWRNAALPSHGAGGDRISNPPLALDLYYLLSAYGPADFVPEILLGYAMQQLHETPVLTRDAIRKALSAAPPPAPVTGVLLPNEARAAIAADLADQVELIKITPHQLNTEEMSKLWTAFQANYRPSTAYHVSVVLIESKRPTRSAPPVHRPNILALPLARPIIDSISPQIAEPGGTVRLKGTNLRGQDTRVFIDATAVAPTTLGETSLEAILPAGLPAGIHLAQVKHAMLFGSPGDPHRGFESNIVAFMLAPQITPDPAPPQPLPVPLPFTVARGATLRVLVTPPVGPSQNALLLIGDTALTLPPRTPASPPAGALDFPIAADFPTGNYLLRLRVDGAESSLQVDTNPVSPTFDQYVGPRLTVT